MKTPILPIAIGLSLASTTALAAPINLVTNGDFEAGNTGFSSSFTFTTGGGLATYGIFTDPKLKNGAFRSFGDHTSGTGNMMVINGHNDGAANKNAVWAQTVSVAANTTYTFSAWIASAFSAPFGEIELNINGTALGSGIATDAFGEWTEVTFDWNSGASTSAMLSLLELSDSFGGNDYALDDISLIAADTTTPVPLPPAGLALGAALLGLMRLRRAS